MRVLFQGASSKGRRGDVVYGPLVLNTTVLESLPKRTSWLLDDFLFHVYIDVRSPRASLHFMIIYCLFGRGRDDWFVEWRWG